MLLTRPPECTRGFLLHPRDGFPSRWFLPQTSAFKLAEQIPADDDQEITSDHFLEQVKKVAGVWTLPCWYMQGAVA